MLSKDDLTLVLQLIEVAPIDNNFANAEKQVKRLMVLRNNVRAAIKEVSNLAPSDVPND